MDMDNLPGNAKHVKVRRAETLVSRAAEPKAQPPEKEPINKIVSGTVVKRKRSIGSRLKSTFFGGETQGVGAFLLEHVLKPAAQDMLADAVREGVDRIVYGDSRGGSPVRGRSSTSSFTGYGSRFSGSGFVNTSLRKDPREEARPALSRQARQNHDFGEIILGSRAEASEVLRQLDGLIQKYDTASVSDLYRMLGETPEWTDNKWGWDHLQGASVRHTRHGYLLDLPPTIPLD